MPGDADDPCPLCGSPLYGWVTLPAEGAPPSLGFRPDPEAGVRVVDRCEACGVGVVRGREVDLDAEMRAISDAEAGGDFAVAFPNRASVQAGLAGDGWAPLGRLPGSLALTPRSLELLGERTGHRVEAVSYPPLGRGQAWMWQSLVNTLTFHKNFARGVHAGRLRPRRGRRPLMFAIDSVVTVLAAPLVALISLPLETVAALLGRGGLIRARAVPVSAAASEPVSAAG